MKFIGNFIVGVLANGLGLWLAARYIGGFHIDGGLRELLFLAVLFTLLNLLIKPVLQLVLTPVIVLTLGLAVFVINAGLLYALDILSQNLTIETVPALILGTLLVGLVNTLFHIAS